MKEQNSRLTQEQRKVLFDKATEAPFSGEYVDKFDDGSYHCANCGNKLFESGAKFHSDCGWPSFDNAILGAVRENIDTTHGMVRTEITCANCGGHLGHVFDDCPRATTGLRYCINSLSLDFTPESRS